MLGAMGLPVKRTAASVGWIGLSVSGQPRRSVEVMMLTELP